MFALSGTIRSLIPFGSAKFSLKSREQCHNIFRMKIKSKFGHTYLIRKGPRKKSQSPLIVLHGGPGGTSMTVEGLLDLSNQRQVIIYDQMGAGKSSAVDKKHWKISTFVTQLDEIVKSLKLESFHLLGASWGATLALEYYKYKKGQGIRSLLLFSPLISEPAWSKDAKRLVKTLPRKQQNIIATCEKIGATDSKVYRDAMALYYKKYVYRSNKKIPLDMKKYRKMNNPQLYRHMWGTSEFSASGTLKNYDGLPILKKVTCPLLIACGQFDESTPATNRKFARLHGKAEFAQVPKAAHATFWENKKDSLKIAKNFLSKVEKSDSI